MTHKPVAAVLALLAAPFVAATVYAQDPAAAPAGGKQPVEEIVVTGSRIPRDNTTTLGPLTVIDAQDIALTSATTIDELLRQIPAVTYQGINRNNNNGGEGLAQIDLRNLGIQRVLVLVNGRRLPLNSTGVSSAVDLNNIPVKMIEKVEVLRDGVSAIYGSDAVAGVINFVMKDDFEGFELDLEGGVSTYGDGEEFSASATAGSNFDGEKGNVTFGITYVDQGEIEQEDRRWGRDPIAAELGRDIRQALAGFGLNFDDHGLVGSSSVLEGRSSSFTYQGNPVGGVFFRPTRSGSSFQPFVSVDNSHRTNYGEFQWLTGELQRINAMMTAEYKFIEETSAPIDDVEVFAEGMFAHRESNLQLAPQPFFDSDGLAIGLYNPNGTLNTRGLPADFLASFGATPLGGPVLSANSKACQSATPPPNCQVRIPFFKRPAEIGPRQYEINADMYRVTSGIEGDLLDQFSWELYLNWGRTETDEITSNSVNQARFFEMADPVECAKAANRGCTVGDFTGPGSLFNTPAALAYAQYDDVEVTIYELLQVGFNFGGTIVELPAGDLAFNLGIEYRDEQGENNPSSVIQAGEGSGNQAGATDGSYDTWEYFAELDIPILKELPGVYDLNLNLAWRYYDYETFGSGDVYRIGLSYAPIEDVTFRGIYNTSFRAPNIPELFGGTAESFETLQDPCNAPLTNPTLAANCLNGSAVLGLNGVPPGFTQCCSQIPANIGGNPDLEPEESDMWNIGMIFTPTFLPDAIENPTFTLDWYTIQIDNAIDNADPQSLLDRCYQNSNFGAGQFDSTCLIAQIVRDGATGEIKGFQATKLNLGLIETSGFDWEMKFGFELDSLGLPPLGRIDVSLLGNHLERYTEVLEGAHDGKEGELLATEGLYSDWTGILTVDFSRDFWTISNRVRYLPEASTPEFGKCPFGGTGGCTAQVDEIWYWDAAASVDLGNWTVVFGVENILDENPPFFPEGGQNASAESYDFVGRFFFSRVTYRF